MQAATAETNLLPGFRTYDPRLEPIAAKVKAGERLDGEAGVALYRSNDVLAVGWLANYVRERMHGDVTYFNVNRHINPTNVCVAACKLCAFGRRKGDPAGYTMALEEAWQTAASGYSEAVTEFHIVGGLHPDLPFEYFLDLVRGLKERFPKVHIKAFTMVEVAYLRAVRSFPSKTRSSRCARQVSIRCREAGPRSSRHAFVPSSAITRSMGMSGWTLRGWRTNSDSNRMRPCSMGILRTTKTASITS